MGEMHRPAYSFFFNYAEFNQQPNNSPKSKILLLDK